MELNDSFTKKLVQRSQARREIIKQKKAETSMCSSKKRSALVDESQISSDDQMIDDTSIFFDESAKRQCVETSDFYDTTLNDDKENHKQSRLSIFVPISGVTIRGLEALKRHTDNDDKSEENSSDINSNSKSEVIQDDSVPENGVEKLYSSCSPVKGDISSKQKCERKLDQSVMAITEPGNELMETENVQKPDINMEDLRKIDTGKKYHTLNRFDPHSFIGSAKDPTELPLNARKALFERACFGESCKPIRSPIVTILPVAQRAAMFEHASQKSATIPRNFLRTSAASIKSSFLNPVASRSPTKDISDSPVQSSPKKNIELKGSLMKQLSTSNLNSTPIKNVGMHANLEQQPLFNISSNDFQPKEVSTKVSNESNQEFSNLVNCWERAISSSSIDISNSELQSTSCSDEIVHHEWKNPKMEDSDQVFKSGSENMDGDVEEANKSESNQECESRALDDDKINNNANEIESQTTSEDMSYETEAVCSGTNISNDSKGICTGTKISNDSTDICSGINISDDAANCESEIPQNLNQEKGSTNSCGSYGSIESNSESIFFPLVSTPMESQSSVLNAPYSPLLHTVSFYRRQKQEVKTVQLRTIIRREQVLSPESPEIDQSDLIQQKIECLQEEVLRQQTVISQTSQALNLCHATAEFVCSTEQVEGERLLLIATQKRQSLLNEIQQLKIRGCEGRSINDGKGTLTISDIQLQLKREYMASQLAGKNDDSVHYFLCVFRNGPQFIVTQMLSTNDKVTDGALCFTNHITIQQLSADFTVAVEVYTLQTKKDVTPYEKKYHIRNNNSKLRLTPKSKRSESRILRPAVSSPGGPDAVRTSNFTVVGYTRFNLQNSIKKCFTLDKVPFSSPLDGILKVKIQLHAEYKVTEKGFLTMFEDVSGFGAWHRRWCTLDGQYLSFWKYPDEVTEKEPIGIFDLKQCVTPEVKLVPRDVCARPHTFQLVTVRPQEKEDKKTLISHSVNTLTTTQHLLSADTKEERALWCNKLNTALKNLRDWNTQPFFN